MVQSCVERVQVAIGRVCLPDGEFELFSCDDLTTRNSVPTWIMDRKVECGMKGTCAESRDIGLLLKKFQEQSLFGADVVMNRGF